MPFHHDPAHDDDTLDSFFDAAGRQAERFTIEPAREDMTFHISERTTI
jgi:hypothetical protein